MHRCTQVQFESRNWSQRVMADCILWLSGGSRLQTRTNHYIMQPREYFWGDSSEVCVESGCVVCVCVCFLQVIQSVPTVQTFAGELITHDRFVFLWTALNESNPFWTYTGKSRCRKWMDSEKKKKHAVKADSSMCICKLQTSNSSTLHLLLLWTLLLVFIVLLQPYPSRISNKSI